MTGRLNLREFQQNLIDRLQAAESSEERVSTVGVQISGRNWLVDMADVAEVLPLPALTPVPFTKPWFRGVANVRGNLYGVVDMAAYEQSGVTPEDSGNRILLVAGRFAFNAALLVEKVLGLRDAKEWDQSDDVGGQVEYRDEQGASWRKLDVSDLLKQAEFLHIGS